jgi:hypothetical protein
LPGKLLWPSALTSTRTWCLRILGKHYRPKSGSGGPSWIFLGQATDSVSIDLFRCESPSLRTLWGPVHSSDHRVWYSPRNCRWSVTVLDVPASDSRAIVADVSQQGQRSVISVPPGKPSSVGGGEIKTDCTTRRSRILLLSDLLELLRRGAWIKHYSGRRRTRRRSYESFKRI